MPWLSTEASCDDGPFSTHYTTIQQRAPCIQVQFYSALIELSFAKVRAMAAGVDFSWFEVMDTVKATGDLNERVAALDKDPISLSARIWDLRLATPCFVFRPGFRQKALIRQRFHQD